jgi:hypothetical protein
MSATKRTFLILLGSLAALFLVAQLVLGQLLASGSQVMDWARLIKSHQHTGYVAVVLALVYVAASLASLAALPARHEATPR